MKLYHASASPPCRSVLMTIRCLGLDVEIQEMNLLKGDHQTPEFLKLNPVGLIPTIADENFALSESRAIMAYLVNSHNNTTYYPSDAKKRAIVDSRLYFDATGVFTHLLAAFRPIFFAGAKEVSEELREKIKQALRHLENFLDGQLYFSGDEPSLADISILSNIIQIKNAFGEIGNFPNIHAWFKRCSTLPGYEENLLGGREVVQLFESFNVKLTPLD